MSCACKFRSLALKLSFYLKVFLPSCHCIFQTVFLPPNSPHPFLCPFLCTCNSLEHSPLLTDTKLKKKSNVTWPLQPWKGTLNNLTYEPFLKQQSHIRPKLIVMMGWQPTHTTRSALLAQLLVRCWRYEFRVSVERGEFTLRAHAF